MYYIFKSVVFLKVFVFFNKPCQESLGNLSCLTLDIKLQNIFQHVTFVSKLDMEKKKFRLYLKIVSLKTV